MLKMNIEYLVKEDEYNVTSNLNKLGQCEVLEAYIRSIMGTGPDTKEREKKDKYRIIVEWYPEDDTIKVRSDVGNDSYTTGVLYSLYQKLSTEIED